ncbi:unnamed protein product [Owenia fusiformis]|uniref:Uncharacterized protein n=1 Tax=Owenia fusiformis TaxID=6347 RepID=A0A8J1T6M0_OWEFU|nr:unnamed protein product [Owenia fusiformis]
MSHKPNGTNEKIPALQSRRHSMNPLPNKGKQGLVTRREMTLPPIQPGHMAASGGRRTSTYGHNMGRRGSRMPKKQEPKVEEPKPYAPSLIGILASKRFAKRIGAKFAQRRAERAAALAARKKEPTYRLEPKENFDFKATKEVVDAILQERLATYKYTPKLAVIMSRVLTEEVRNEVKKLGFDRYKIIVHVTIGENKAQDMRITSRCVWDPSVDTFVTSNFQNSEVFCTTTVYAVYFS